MIAHNLFRFDFFFSLEGLRSGVWRTRNITIGGKNPTDINFASIGNQVQFLDTIRYFQQSLSSLASSLTDKQREAIYRECEEFLCLIQFSRKDFVCVPKMKRNGYLIICHLVKVRSHMN